MKRVESILLALIMLFSCIVFDAAPAFADDSPVKKVMGGWGQTVALLSDGTAISIGYDKSGLRDVEHWTELADISCGTYHTVGARADGTVLVAGDNGCSNDELAGWTDVIAVAGGYYFTVGLKADGTMHFVGKAGMDSSDKLDLSHWSDVTSISANIYHVVGLRSDGTVLAEGGSFNTHGECDVQGWTDMTAVAAGDWHTVGLKADGTVRATGANDNGQCNVSGWSDVVGIAAGSDFTVGLKADGTVYATGNNKYGQCDVDDWTDIIAISAGYYCTIGLKADGTVLILGENTYGTSDADALNQAISSHMSESKPVQDAVAATGSVSADNTPSEGFRLRNGILFGDSFADVAAKETFSLTGNQGIHSVTGGKFCWTAPGTVSGFDNTAVGFIFSPGDELVEMHYHFGSITSESPARARYETIHEGLVRKYGEPLELDEGEHFSVVSNVFKDASIFTAFTVFGYMGAIDEYSEWIVPIDDIRSVKIDIVSYYWGPTLSDLDYEMRVGYKIYTTEDINSDGKDKLTQQEIVDIDL